MTQPSTKVLIATDLDRTLIPNGPQPESTDARPRFRTLIAHPNVGLAYVSGRHRELVMQAIEEYDLPMPDYVIGDVGTSIYRVDADRWVAWSNWSEQIAQSWGNRAPGDLARSLMDIEGLKLQEAAKQGPYKLSYYTPADWDRANLLAEIERRLSAHEITSNLIWSLDESTGTGLLDILPGAASKQSAIVFLMQQAGYKPTGTLCCGDSGNDLAMLTGPLQAVLVANATDEVRAEALALAEQAGTLDKLYLAKGDFEGMNGCYSAGILEGLAHYLPETRDWWKLPPTTA